MKIQGEKPKHPAVCPQCGQAECGCGEEN